MDIGDIEIVGGPGCFACPGHLSLAEAFEMLRLIVNEFDEGLRDLEPPRHTWMVVTPTEEVDGDQEYREVVEGTEGAIAYTIYPVYGYWPAKPEPTTEGDSHDR